MPRRPERRALGRGSTSTADDRGWRLLAGWLLLAALFLCGSARATPEPPLLHLDPSREVPVAALAWFGQQPLAGIDAATGGRLPFQRFAAHQPVPFQPGTALWLKLRVQPPAASTDQWQLEVPVPVIDRVTVYQQDASGRWFARVAGDTVAMGDWPQPGRYPFFRLKVRPGEPSDIYVEVRHATALSLPLRVVTSLAHHERTQIEYLALGIALGALALLVAGSLLRAWRLRDTAYAWYAVYALAAMFALAAFTGVAAHLLWGDSGEWVDAAPGCLTLLASSVAVLIVARLSAVLTRIRWLARSLHLLGWIGLVLAGMYLLLERGTGIVLLGLHLVAVATLCVYSAVVTWRRGDPVGLWMLPGAVPLAIAVAVALARVSGVLQASWITEYALVLALTLDLPLLFGALNSRSEERRSVELRRIASDSQDPLTGLMKRGPFLARLRQAIARYQRRGEGAALAVIELANYEWIQKTRGAEAAEEALLRAVIKLRRLVRDVDTTGRLGEHRFGLILEGVSARRPMNAVASRLVANGLMEEPGRPRDAVLHFHVAAVVLHEQLAASEDLLDSLDNLLAGMSKRTQRPFRFLESGSMPAEIEPPPDTVVEDSGMAPA